MTLCGLLFGTEPAELAEKLKVRNVTKVDIVYYCSTYELGSPRFSVRVDEIDRVNGRPAFFSDRILYRDSTYNGERFVSAFRKSFHYPVAGGIAFETAELLQKSGINVTVEGKLPGIAEAEFREEIKKALDCQGL